MTVNGGALVSLPGGTASAVPQRARDCQFVTDLGDISIRWIEPRQANTH